MQEQKKQLEITLDFEDEDEYHQNVNLSTNDLEMELDFNELSTAIILLEGFLTKLKTIAWKKVKYRK